MASESGGNAESTESNSYFEPHKFILEVVAYAGYSTLSLASTAPFIYATYREDALKQDHVIVSTLVSNIIAGTMLLVYGILTGDKPLRYTMPCLVGMSVVGLIGKVAVFIKKYRQERLY